MRARDEVIDEVQRQVQRGELEKVAKNEAIIGKRLEVRGWELDFTEVISDCK